MSWKTRSSRPRKPYLLINPEARLWIGVFKRWVHAWLHLRGMMIDWIPPEGWFICSLEEWNNRYANDRRGWVKCEEPIYMKWHRTCEHPKYRTLDEVHGGAENLLR